MTIEIKILPAIVISTGFILGCLGLGFMIGSAQIEVAQLEADAALHYAVAEVFPESKND